MISKIGVVYERSVDNRVRLFWRENIETRCGALPYSYQTRNTMKLREACGRGLTPSEEMRFALYQLQYLHLGCEYSQQRLDALTIASIARQSRCLRRRSL